MCSLSSREDYDILLGGLALKVIQKPLKHKLSSESSHKITHCTSSALLYVMPLSKETQWQQGMGEVALLSWIVLDKLREMQFTQLRNG